ncbi:MAG TPA: ATP phosphoribosyltransferase [Anaerolineales bacterium]|nr:ATP phosphoribosyltransferase [Anaerolineales bacterium]
MRTDIRLALPSKGRLEQDALEFLADSGLRVEKPNPRQYMARIPNLPGLTVIFQRPGDIVVSVREGSVDFGITGLDVTEERRGSANEVVVIHEALGFGGCQLALAVPEEWPVERVEQLRDRYGLRIATKYPVVTKRYLETNGVSGFSLIDVEGTLEVAPAIGYADAIVDLVSSGQTLRDNRLRALADGVVLRSQAGLIANRAALVTRPEVLTVAHQLLELVEAHLRGQENYMVVANMRGQDPDAIARALFAQPELNGLQGPTVAPVYAHTGERWHSVTIVVRKDHIIPAVKALRAVGGSGVIVTPVTYIFEEEPERARRLNDVVATA